MVKWRLLIATAMSSVLLSASAMAASGTLVVNVTGIPGTRGDVRVGLYDQASLFPKEGRHMANQVARPAGGKATVRFENVPYGDYAIAVLYDVDGDGKMKKNLVGAPLEPVGFSAGAQVGPFGPPDFEKARFRLGAPLVTQSVSVK